MASARERRRKEVLDKARRLAVSQPKPDEAAPPKPRVITHGLDAGVVDRDGWEWFKARHTLDQRQKNAGDDYRFCFRAQDGVPVKSCLDPDSVGGGSGPRSFQPPAVETPLDAKRW